MAAFTLLSSELDGFRSELIEIVAAGTRPKAPQNAETLKEVGDLALRAVY